MSEQILSKKKEKSKKLPKIATIAYNMNKLFKKFLLEPYFEYGEIWLNILMDDHQLSN
jgi:hypothetical protein